MDGALYVDKALQGAGVPVLCLPAKKGCIIGEIREAIAKKLRIKTSYTTYPFMLKKLM